MMRRNRGFISVFLLALLVRIAVVWYATLWRENTDVLRYRDWVRIGFTHGFAATYNRPELLTFGTYPNNQPPGTVYLLTLPYHVWLTVGKTLALFGVAPGSNQWVNGPLLNIFLRIPSLAADFVIAWLIYTIVRTYAPQSRQRPIPGIPARPAGGKAVSIPGISRKSGALLAASLFLFNPAVLYNSAFWGQMDAVNNALFLAGLWLLLRPRFIWSAILLAGSFLIKFSLLFATPLYAILVWVVAGKRKWTLLTMLGVAALVTFLAVAPISRYPLTWYGNFVAKNASGEMLNVTAFAFNFWWVVFRPLVTFGKGPDLFSLSDIRLSGSPLTPTRYGGVSLGAIAVGLSVLAQGAVYWVLWRKRLRYKGFSQVLIFSTFAALSILAFLTLPKMHDRYLYPAWAPLAILIGFGVPVLYELFLLSLLNFMNLVIVWHPMPLPPWLYPIMRSQSFQWWVAMATVAVGLWTYYKLIRVMQKI